MQDNFDNVISNTLLVNKDNIVNNVKKLVNDIKESLIINKDSLIDASNIDQKNNNGFIIDFDIIKSVLSNLDKIDLYYGDVILSLKDDNKKLVYGKQVMDVGNVVVITDGNPYVLIEMIVKNIIAGNTTIISNNGFMFGTNNLIINIVQSVLERFNISKNLVQLYVSEEFDEVFKNFANIDLVVCIGNHNLQSMVLSKSKNKTIVSGYDNFDLYIEDDKNIDIIKKILNSGLNIQLYLNKGINIEYPNTLEVNDIEEAISIINYNGSRYSSAIFTSSSDNASKFIKNIKSSLVTINTSPTIERLVDIDEKDLILEKTIVYPLGFNIKNNSKINL